MDMKKLKQEIEDAIKAERETLAGLRQEKRRLKALIDGNNLQEGDRLLVTSEFIDECMSKDSYTPKMVEDFNKGCYVEEIVHLGDMPLLVSDIEHNWTVTVSRAVAIGMRQAWLAQEAQS